MDRVCYLDVEKAKCSHTTKGGKIKGMKGHITCENKVDF